MSKILLDINCPIFHEQLFNLEKLERRAFLNTLKKIRQLEWQELYKDKGIRWELIISEKTSKESNIYSFRFSKKYRATAYRDNNYLVMLALFVDHDSAYK
jgi:hypothetical protein